MAPQSSPLSTEKGILLAFLVVFTLPQASPSLMDEIQTKAAPCWFVSNDPASESGRKHFQKRILGAEFPLEENLNLSTVRGKSSPSCCHIQAIIRDVGWLWLGGRAQPSKAELGLG